MSDIPVIKWLANTEQAEGDSARSIAGEPPPVALWAVFRFLSDQDCACPSVVNDVVAEPASPNGRWRRPPSLYRDALPGGHQIVFSPATGCEIAVMNAPAIRILDAFERPRGISEVASLLKLDMADVARAALDLAWRGLLEPVVD